MSSKFRRWVRGGCGARRPAPARRRERRPDGPGAWGKAANWAGGVRPGFTAVIELAPGEALPRASDEADPGE